MSAEDEVTDNIPLPQTRTSDDGPEVTLRYDGSTAPGRLQGVSGDTLTITTGASLTMDAEVEVSAGSVSGTGVVIWTRAGSDGNAVGIEVLGGTEEWARLY